MYFLLLNALLKITTGYFLEFIHVIVTSLNATFLVTDIHVHRFVTDVDHSNHNYMYIVYHISKYSKASLIRHNGRTINSDTHSVIPSSVLLHHWIKKNTKIGQSTFIAPECL